MSRSRTATVLALAIGLVSVSAVAAQSPAPPEGTPWVLAELRVDGELSDVPGDVMVTLLMEDGQASGSSGCNSYSGRYALRGETLAFEPLMSTKMMCAETAMTVEAAYLADLAQVASFELGRSDMTMRDTAGEAVLVFEHAEAPSIAGGWVVTRYRNEGGDLVSPAAGSILTAVFGPDGTLEGSSGCNHFSASYTVDGGDITVGSLSTTRMACASPELQQQETDFLNVLGASTQWTLAGTDLVLVDASGLVDRDTTVELTAEVEASYIGSWIVTGFDMGNGSIVVPIADSELSAAFSVDGAIEGNAGCNQYSGPFTVSGWAMTVGPLATSLSACGDELDTQEQQYLAALQAVTSWAPDATGMVLSGVDGAPRVTLAPAP